MEFRTARKLSCNLPHLKNKRSRHKPDPHNRAYSPPIPDGGLRTITILVRQLLLDAIDAGKLDLANLFQVQPIIKAGRLRLIPDCYGHPPEPTGRRPVPEIRHALGLGLGPLFPGQRCLRHMGKFLRISF